jgi:hypothetical protein
MRGRTHGHEGNYHLVASAFITFQFLQYGSSLLATPQSNRSETSSHSSALKGVGRVSEIVRRLSIVAVVAMLGTYCLVDTKLLANSD